MRAPRAALRERRGGPPAVGQGRTRSRRPSLGVPGTGGGAGRWCPRRRPACRPRLPRAPAPPPGVAVARCSWPSTGASWGAVRGREPSALLKPPLGPLTCPRPLAPRPRPPSDARPGGPRRGCHPLLREQEGLRHSGGPSADETPSAGLAAWGREPPGGAHAPCTRAVHTRRAKPSPSPALVPPERSWALHLDSGAN